MAPPTVVVLNDSDPHLARQLPHSLHVPKDPTAPQTQPRPGTLPSRERFSRATRRLPLLLFWMLMLVVVVVAGVLAHSWQSANDFLNRDAVLDRSALLARSKALRVLDAIATATNTFIISGGWMLAAAWLAVVQGTYILLLAWKRQRVRTLRFMRVIQLRQIALIELAVLLASGVYFVLVLRAKLWISSMYGSCYLFSVSDSLAHLFTTRAQCRPPFTFRGFNISGHCFLIVHALLLWLEYLAKVLYLWIVCRSEGIDVDAGCRTRDAGAVFDEESSFSEPEALAPPLDDQAAEKNATERLEYPDFYARYPVALRVLLVLVTALTLGFGSLAFLVFVQTILFYHTVAEKVLGSALGATFWMGLFVLSLKYPHIY